MKKLLLIPFTILLFSCNKEDKMQSQIKEYVNKNFDDPKSYEPVDFKITDTLTVGKTAKVDAEDETSMLKDYKIELQKLDDQMKEITLNNYTDLKKEQESDIENTKILIKETEKELAENIKNKNSKIVYAYIAQHSFRGKNKLGALILNKKYILFDNEEKMIGMYDEENIPHSEISIDSYGLLDKTIGKK